MIELWIFIAAAVIVWLFARMGVNFGVFYEVTSTLYLFLAMLVALRFWHPLTEWIAPWLSGEQCYAAFVAYWILFLLGSTPLIGLMSRVTEGTMPRYPELLDRVIGFIFGGLSAAIIICTVLTSWSVIAPKVWPDYQRDRLLWQLDRQPIIAYQAIEEKLLRIAPTDPAHTRFPTFEKADVDNANQFWK